MTEFFLANPYVYFYLKVLWTLLYLHLLMETCVLNWKSFILQTEAAT